MDLAPVTVSGLTVQNADCTKKERYMCFPMCFPLQGRGKLKAGICTSPR